MVALMREKGTDGWNSYVNAQREADPNWSTEFRDADVRGLNMQGTPGRGPDFSHMKFTGLQADDKTNFNYANLSHSTIEKSELPGTQMKTTQMNGTKFIDNNAPGLNIENATCDSAQFKNNTMPESNLSGTHWGGRALLQKNELPGSQIAGMELSSARADGNNLSDATSFNAKGENVPLVVRNSVLENNNFNHTKIPEAQIEGSRLAASNTVSGANLNGIRLNGTDAQGFDFTEAQANNLFVGGANLKGAQMREEQKATLEGGKAGADNLTGMDRKVMEGNNGLQNLTAKSFEDKKPVETASAAPAAAPAASPPPAPAAAASGLAPQGPS